jgi:hypothetical protein
LIGGRFSFKSLWILARTPTITNYDYLHDLALKLSGMHSLVPTQQIGCTYPN